MAGVAAGRTVARCWVVVEMAPGRVQGRECVPAAAGWLESPWHAYPCAEAAHPLGRQRRRPPPSALRPPAGRVPHADTAAAARAVGAPCAQGRWVPGKEGRVGREGPHRTQASADGREVQESEQCRGGPATLERFWCGCGIAAKAAGWVRQTEESRATTWAAKRQPHFALEPAQPCPTSAHKPTTWLPGLCAAPAALPGSVHAQGWDPWQQGQRGKAENTPSRRRSSSRRAGRPEPGR